MNVNKRIKFLVWLSKLFGYTMLDGLDELDRMRAELELKDSLIDSIIAANENRLDDELFNKTIEKVRQMVKENKKLLAHNEEGA